VAATGSLHATTFFVPSDRDLIHKADAIVLGSALTSFTQINAEGGIETVTPFSVTDVIRGSQVSSVIDIVEPGGTYHDMTTIIAGVPQFSPGQRLLLFLKSTAAGRWAVEELVLGKFRFRNDVAGRSLLLRDTDEIVGWDAKLRPYSDRARDADSFLQFVRNEARGITSDENYFVNDPVSLRLQSSSITASGAISPAVTAAAFTANSYTMFISGSQGARWTVFPGAVVFFSGTTTEPGAPGGGITAIQTALASWSNDCSSNVNYQYGGADSGGHTQGLHGVDGANTVLFERDLSSWGVSPFTCSGSGYSGTLGIGGVTSASGSNSVNGETFVTTQEADVEMNRGIANCTLLFNNGDFNSAVTHEIGHTLGFRHSDQTRDSASACSSDPTLECSSLAIMKSFISTGLNAALQAWDQHAVAAVYPGNICVPGTCTTPAITSQPSATTIIAGQSATLTVGASGTAPLSYQWYTGASGNTSSPVPGGTGSSVTVAPATTTSYWAKVSNSCGFANSASATVTVTTNTASAATKFFLVTPCRIIDTRNPNGPQGGPALSSGTNRNIVVGGVCGVPTGAVAISVNLAVIDPGNNGFMTLYAGPASNPLPLASTINYKAGRVLANNAVVRTGSDSINAYNSGPSAVHFVIDVNGYFK
jgi:hypothetical protein